MKQRQKPVRKCHGCELNIGDRCGVYAVPRQMWHHRRCPGYENDAMLADPSKQTRRAVAKQRASEPHWQGTLPLANR